MDSIMIATSVVVNIFNWVFRNVGGKRMATVLSLVIVPGLLLAVNPDEAITFILPVCGIILAAIGIYAIKQTRFYAIPLSACDGKVKTAAWASMIIGYLVIGLLFLELIIFIFLMSAVFSGITSSFLGSSRRR